MAGTYSKLHIQVIFAVKGRGNLLHKSWRAEVFKYISGIITNKDQKAIIVNGVSDHVHAFIGLRPAMSISDLVRDMKNNSSKFINESGFLKTKFSWQSGFGAFSYSHSHIDRVYKYIENQETHHRKVSFREEYNDFLEKYEIPFDKKYLFDFIEGEIE